MAHTALLAALREWQPRSVIVVGDGRVRDALDAYCAERRDTTVLAVRDAGELPSEGAQLDVALIGGVVGVWPDAAARELLGALRDRYCRRMLVLARASAWPLTEYLALGFERRAALADGLELYEYDFDRYNPEREWNNPQHWANPENFKRYRW